MMAPDRANALAMQCHSSPCYSMHVFPQLADTMSLLPPHSADPSFAMAFQIPPASISQCQDTYTMKTRNHVDVECIAVPLPLLDVFIVMDQSTCRTKGFAHIEMATRLRDKTLVEPAKIPVVHLPFRNESVTISCCKSMCDVRRYLQPSHL